MIVANRLERGRAPRVRRSTWRWWSSVSHGSTVPSSSDAEAGQRPRRCSRSGQSGCVLAPGRRSSSARRRSRPSSGGRQVGGRSPPSSGKRRRRCDRADRRRRSTRRRRARAWRWTSSTDDVATPRLADARAGRDHPDARRRPGRRSSATVAMSYPPSGLSLRPCTTQVDSGDRVAPTRSSATTPSHSGRSTPARGRGRTGSGAERGRHRTAAAPRRPVTPPASSESRHGRWTRTSWRADLVTSRQRRLHRLRRTVAGAAVTRLGRACRTRLPVLASCRGIRSDGPWTLAVTASDPRTSLGAPASRRACLRPPSREVVSVFRKDIRHEADRGQALIKSLEMEGVEVMFGLPGGCILPVYDPILDSPIRHILVRHEQGAGHMAEGYAHVTGRPGVAMVTSGPGGHQHRHAAVRRLHGLDPDGRASPARCRTAAIGTDAFQECDTVGITRSVTKHNELVTDGRGHPAGHPRGVPHRHHRPARPGAASTSPRTSSTRRTSSMDWYWPTDDDGRRLAARLPADDEGPPPHDQGGGAADPGRRAPGASTPAAASSRPGPPRRCASWPSCTDIHVVTTLMARGAFPDDHPLCLGMPGMHGNYTAVTVDAAVRPARSRSAARFDDRVTGKVAGVRPRRQDHPRRHRPGRAGQGAPARRADRRRLPARHRGARQGASQALLDGGADAARHVAPGSSTHLGLAGAVPAHLRAVRARRGAQAAVRASSSCATTRPRTRSSPRASASTRCGRRSTGSSTTPTRG